MKKQIAVLSGCALALLLSSPVFSAEQKAMSSSLSGLYVSGHAGMAMVGDSDWTNPLTTPGVSQNAEFDPGLALSGALGYAFGNARVEGEVGYQKSSFDSMNYAGGGPSGVPGNYDAAGDTAVQSLLANGYYGFPTGTAITPFVTAGLGVAKVEVDGYSILGGAAESADDTVLAYQLGAGLDYAINKSVNLDLKYRFFATADPEFDAVGPSTTSAEFSSHNVMLGVRVGL